VPESFAQWTPPQPLPVEIAEDVAVDLVETLFLFDRLFTKSATATSPDYLERVSEPSSKFYPDYLEYQQGRISRAELVRRLPHIAMLGDSQSKNMYISSIPSLVWRARTERRKNWFLDTDPAPQSVYSVYERFEKFTPLVATEYGGNGALVAPSQTTPTFLRRLLRSRDLSGQVNQVLRNKRFPDLVMILIGNNNGNYWTEGLSSSELKHPEKRLRKIAGEFGENYTQQLRVLIDRAKTQDHKVAIVVFGLVDFKKYFKARQKAEALHASNRKLYPYIEVFGFAKPLEPANQKNTTRLALMMNSEMRTMVSNLNKELTNYPNVQLEYSDAFSNLDGSRLELVHPMDAIHLSRTGHNVFAQAAFTALAPSLHFFGIEPYGDRSRRSQAGH